jgi:hypothetical protein
MTTLDPELEALARLALINQFWLNFGDLVAAYQKKAEGLDSHEFNMQMQEHSSVYGCADSNGGDVFINLWCDYGNGRTANLDTMLQALAEDDALSIHLNGEKIFERRDGEWYCVGD